MNISENRNFSSSVRFCLYDSSSTIPCVVSPCYMYINIFNYYILQYILNVYIYPRWLGVLIDKDKE